MNGSWAAEKWWDSRGDYVEEHEMHDIAWELFLVDAVENAAFVDDNGEWIEGYPDKLEESKEWNEYCNDFCSTLMGIQTEVRFFEEKCGSDMYSYYGVRRSDFA